LSNGDYDGQPTPEDWTPANHVETVGDLLSTYVGRKGFRN